LNKFIETFKDIQKLVGDIYTGDAEREVDEDTFNQIIGSNKDLANDFVETHDGFMYIGNSMLDLADALMESTEVQRQKNLERIDDMQLATEIATALGDQNAKYNMSNIQALSSAEQRDYIASMVESMKASGASASAF
jgi:hypothetical protein